MRAHVMIVDDSRAQLALLDEWMKDLGYSTNALASGEEALASAESDPPDLVLLDVNMPEMDGYEVCRRFKKNPMLSDIPVIFISASGDTNAKVEAFRGGGVDYVTKPFRLDEVKARVETHLKVSRLQRQLEEHNRSLEDLVRERTTELAEAHARLELLDRAKSDFLQLISHELRTPLNGVLGISDIILNEMGEGERAKRLSDIYQLARHHLLAIVDDALLLTQIGVGGGLKVSTLLRITDLVQESSELAKPVADAKQVDIVQPGGSDLTLRGDQQLLVRAFAGLVETAIKLSAKNGRVVWSVDSLPGGVKVVLKTHGNTIPETALLRFFDVFSANDPVVAAGDLGLRHVVAERIISLNRGTIDVTNTDPRGVRFDISFPAEGS